MPLTDQQGLLKQFRRYEQPGRLHVVYSRSPPSIIEHCQFVANHFTELLARRLVVPVPEPITFSAPPAALSLGEEEEEIDTRTALP